MFSTEEFERGSNHCKIPGIGTHVIGIQEDRTYVIGNYLQEAL